MKWICDQAIVVVWLTSEEE